VVSGDARGGKSSSEVFGGYSDVLPVIIMWDGYIITSTSRHT
jgi:hypothetical protein